MERRDWSAIERKKERNKRKRNESQEIKEQGGRARTKEGKVATCTAHTTHVSVSPTIVTGRLHERGGRGDGEPTIYIIVASSLATHTFVFIGRRRGGKATGGIFGPVRPEILR